MSRLHTEEIEMAAADNSRTIADCLGQHRKYPRPYEYHPRPQIPTRVRIPKVGSNLKGLFDTTNAARKHRTR